MKQKVGNGRGGGGDSDPSDLVVKKKRERKRKGKNIGEMATPPRSDRCWSRSPSPGGEGWRRGPKTVLKWVFGFRRSVWVFLGKSLEGFFPYISYVFLAQSKRVDPAHIVGWVTEVFILLIVTIKGDHY